MKKDLISILIPVYNDLKLYSDIFVLKFLDSVEKNKPTKCDFEIILIDDDSPDKSYIGSLSKYKDLNIRFIQNNKNLCFQKTINNGAKIAQGKYIIIGNQDIILTQTSIDNLYTYMENNKDVAVCGPKMIFSDNTIFDSYRKFPHLLYYVIKRTPLNRLKILRKYVSQYLMWDKDPNKTENVDWLVFSWVMINKNIFFDLNMLDERFKHFNGDTDFCLTCKKNNYKVVYVSDSLIINSKRRLSAGGLKDIFKNKFIRIHIVDAIKFFIKWRFI